MFDKKAFIKGHVKIGMIEELKKLADFDFGNSDEEEGEIGDAIDNSADMIADRMMGVNVGQDVAAMPIFGALPQNMQIPTFTMMSPNPVDMDNPNPMDRLEPGEDYWDR